MAAPESAPLQEVWTELGKLRRYLELTGYDVTADGAQLLAAIAALETAWSADRHVAGARFYDDVYLLVRRLGTGYGETDTALLPLAAETLKALVAAKKALIDSIAGGSRRNPA